MRNRMRETCTSGSVRGGDGNVPTYSAGNFEQRRLAAGGGRLEQPREAGIAVGVQEAAAAAEQRLGADALAVRGVAVERRWRHL
jgi:hypothetical protein